MAINCQMAGLVGISGACNCVSLSLSCLIGAVSSLVYMISRATLKRFEVDDPLNVTSIHLMCGIWGLIAVGLFANETGIVISGNPYLITTQMYGIFAIIGWAFTTSYLFFLGF